MDVQVVALWYLGLSIGLFLLWVSGIGNRDGP
jgi:hypothetical protein